MGDLPSLPEGEAAEAPAGHSRPKPAREVQALRTGDRCEYRCA
nr:MAG TPA: hypothetical protein [Caudoviricetes sp.]